MWAAEQEDLHRARSALRCEGDPKNGDHLAWLARLRHQGQPVRLLDFTRRLGVATFFATEEPSPDAPAIWAVDGYRLEAAWRLATASSESVLRVNGPAGNCTEFNRLYAQGFAGHAAMFVEPRAPNRRQELQDGLFLVGLDVSKSLEESLFGCLGYEPGRVNPDIGPHGLPTGPVGFDESASTEPVRAKLQDALLVQIILKVPEAEMASHLNGEGISRGRLGF
jgi:hypothetical protein